MDASRGPEGAGRTWLPGALALLPRALSLLLMVLAVAYVVAIPLGLVTIRLGQGEVAVLAVVLLVNSGVLGELQELAISEKGVSLKLREQVRRLQGEVEALRFLIKFFVNKYELDHLRKLAGDGAFPYERWVRFDEELRHLRALGLLETYPGQGITNMPASGDLKEHLAITEDGRSYLRLRDQWAVEGEARRG